MLRSVKKKKKKKVRDPQKKFKTQANSVGRLISNRDGTDHEF